MQQIGHSNGTSCVYELFQGIYKPSEEYLKFVSLLRAREIIESSVGLVAVAYDNGKISLGVQIMSLSSRQESEAFRAFPSDLVGCSRGSFVLEQIAASAIIPKTPMFLITNMNVSCC